MAGEPSEQAAAPTEKMENLHLDEVTGERVCPPQTVTALDHLAPS